MNQMSKEKDFLNFSKDPTVLNLIKGETILVSSKMEKINDFGFTQERNALITNKAFYNLKKTTLKRRIEILNICGVTSSNINDEFVIHCLGIEYDYHIISKRKKLIIEALAKSYYDMTNNYFKFCLIDSKSLKNYVTSKDDKKKNKEFSKMPKTGFTPISNYFSDLKSENTSPMLSKKSSSVESESFITSRDDFKNVKLSDFKVLKVLGRGTFGKVTLVEFSKTKELFAMKSIKKDILIDQEQITNVFLEKKILSSIDHIFIVRLVCSFQTKERIYFVMPFLRGGELFMNLRKSRIFEEDKARFYSAQIAISINILHSIGIIYRDLKPENILIDEDGYIKLTDFGMAKQLKGDEKAITFCGTPEYISPEIINSKPYGKETDWWTFGILLYEMLCGIPPFYNENHDRMFQSITSMEVKFPKKITLSDEAKDIIIKLLDKNQKTRLGVNGFIEIRNHPFFLKIDFDSILKKKITPPFIPVIKNKFDVGNFDKEFTEERIEESVIPQKNLNLIERNQEAFIEFDKK